MTDDNTQDPAPPDEAWLHDYALEGIAAVEWYLGKHARFMASLEAWGLSDYADGDGAAH